MKKLIAILSLAVAACSPAYAQTVKVATGSAKGTYSTQTKEMVQACGNTLPLVEINTNGAMQNIDMLLGNEVSAAYTQGDVLWLRARTEELGHVKTLLAMHPEQMHMVVSAAGKTEGGVMGLGATTVHLRDWSNLAGRQVAASGGSAVSAKIIRLQSEIPFTVVEYPTNDAALAAVAKGGADAALLVGGAPLPVLKSLNNAFRLLPTGASVQEKLKGVYKPARVTYNNMNSQGITTVSTDALLVTRTYSSPKMLGALSAFRSCVLESLPDLKDTAGTHPSWQAVDGANKGRWAWYDLPASKK